ncbi:serine/threonine-protein kinase [Arthrobacter stackebrandtii]|uniref:non-specific serine/threonine protein kinase n=1 Tax=Arthrobacter stackebrandtii TaxID=272161 RepID=A0ABS4Z1S2_9MICC|nr:serine/threonine-protein kinase [Arthrobacter stackebrandtii]PYH00853.1 serine/threonine protein kinase [Arthrobacter stackebrandtii]
MQEVSADPLIGSIVDGRYQVLSKVADGGMSTVYRAKDLRLGRHIALKILPAELASNAAFIAALGSEAASAASLSHPHVVQIHDHAVSPEHAYLVYEFIDGHTLRDVIRQRAPLSPRTALDLLDPVVEGLAAAHAAGIVHRDVKPENVLISRQGWVKIGDFGLSHAASAANLTGELLGTVHYIAPELALRRGSDARSDIYSAGIVLYELLTGKKPFTGTDRDIVTAQARQDVPAPSLLVPGLPAVMDELVRYMTEKDPDHRPADGAALLEDLRHIRRTLDTGEPEVGSPAADANSRTEVIAAPFDQEFANTGEFTEAIPSEATTVIAATSFATSVMPLPSSLYPDLPDAGHPAAADPGTDPAPASGDGGADDAPPARLSKRQAKALDKTERKQALREASTPRTTLGPAHPRRRALLWTLLVVFLAVLAAAAGWFLGFGPGALADVPDVHNKTVPQATELLRTAGFDNVPTSGIFDEKVAEGFVVNTDPSAGESLRKFSAVTLLVSRGPVLFAVPQVAGGTLDAAKTALADGNLAVGSVTEQYDEKVPAGVVLSQDPAAGEEFRGNTAVNLVVSLGPKPIPVPAVTGLPQADAEAALQAAGLVAAVAPEQQNSVSVPAGSVLSQSPDSGELKAGDTVTLTISMGPKMIDVPSMVGKQVGAATAELKALGFEVEVKNLLGGFFGTVRFQTPDGGQAPEGSTIVLQVI